MLYEYGLVQKSDLISDYVTWLEQQVRDKDEEIRQLEGCMSEMERVIHDKRS